MAYPKVHIVNSTNFSVKGKVKYASAFSSDDNYEIAPWGSWTAGSRGVCLLTEVSATVHTPGQDAKATPYESSGTSYSQFAVLQTAPGKFTMTRIVTSDKCRRGPRRAGPQLSAVNTKMMLYCFFCHQ